MKRKSVPTGPVVQGLCSEIMSSHKRVAAAATTTKSKRVALDSSDEEGQPAEEIRGHVRQTKPLFSKQAIFDAVLGTHSYSVRSHVPSFVSPPEVQADWNQWLKSTAQTLADVPTSARALPIQMPMKCTEAPQARSSDVPATVVQRDLIVYRNPDGGSSLSAAERAYDARQATRLVEGMTDIDDTVIVKRPEDNEAETPGYRTPFYLGKVLCVHFEQSAASSSTDTRDIARLIRGVDVHWCYPFFNGAPCDDVRRPWKRACVGLLHEWDASCDTRKKCIACRQPDQSTSREWSYVPAEALLEMGVKMTPTTHALAAGSKEKLAAYSATWAKALAKDVLCT